MATTGLSTAETLRAAADIIDQRGWYQGAYIGPDDSVCLLGACYYAARTDPYDDAYSSSADGPAAYREAVAALADRLGVDVVAELGTWNDRQHRTAFQVTNLLRLVADELTQRED